MPKQYLRQVSSDIRARESYRSQSCLPHEAKPLFEPLSTRRAFPQLSSGTALDGHKEVQRPAQSSERSELQSPDWQL
jgi:hypothetical protein